MFASLDITHQLSSVAARLAVEQSIALSSGWKMKQLQDLAGLGSIVLPHAQSLLQIIHCHYSQLFSPQSQQPPWMCQQIQVMLLKTWNQLFLWASGRALPEVFARRDLIVRLELVPLNNVILDTSYHTRAQLLKLNVCYVLPDFIALPLVSLIHMTQ